MRITRISFYKKDNEYRDVCFLVGNWLTSEDELKRFMEIINSIVINRCVQMTNINF